MTANPNDSTEPSFIRQVPSGDPTTGATRPSGRQLADIKLTTETTMERVEAAWGPPDAVQGSGTEHWVYALEDGRRLRLWFASQAPHPLLRAVLLPDAVSRTGEVLFDGTKDTKLR
jgi:hypothetical protein